MKRKNAIFLAFSILFSFLLPAPLWAAHWQSFTGDPSTPAPYALFNRPGVAKVQSMQSTNLQAEGSTTTDPLTHQQATRYQQYYYGVPVNGAQIVVHQSENANRSNMHAFGVSRAQNSKVITGQLLQDIRFDPTLLRSFQEDSTKAAALQSVQQQFLSKLSDSGWTIQQSNIQLMITLYKDQVLPVYYLSWSATHPHKSPIRYRAYVKAESPSTILQQWDAVMHYEESGEGGNLNTGRYYYGQNGIPFLNVKQALQTCTLDDGFVRVVSLFQYDRGKNSNGSDYLEPFSYLCGSSQRDPAPFQGAYSVTNDAYFFGQIVDQMYLSWFSVHPVQDNMTLRVHYGENHESISDAFWDPNNRTMNFGDGEENDYPLVSLDVAAHEISHGFTSDHANMEYHDESGGLNESFSDMAAMAAQQYLIDTHLQVFMALYGQTEPAWKLGHLTSRNHEPLRYLDAPSNDRESTDCLEQVDNCIRSYDSLQQYGSIDPHYGSGVFNHAFYYLATMPNWGIKKAFILMTVSNRDGYWSTGGLDQSDYFNQAACGTIAAARALNYETDDVFNAFHKVGVITHTSCNAPTPPHRI